MEIPVKNTVYFCYEVIKDIVIIMLTIWVYLRSLVLKVWCINFTWKCVRNADSWALPHIS